MKSNLMILASVLCLFSINTLARGGQSSEEGSVEGRVPLCFIGTDSCDPSFENKQEGQVECGYDIGTQKGSWQDPITGKCIIIGGDEG